MTKKRSLYISRTAIFLGMVIAMQYIGLQFIPAGIGKLLVVSSLVNFILLFATRVVGFWSGALIGTITPIMAFALGHAPVAIQMPFTITANLSLVTVFYFISKIKDNLYIDIVGVVASSVVKFLIMFLTVKFIFPKIPGMKPPMIKALLLSWSWPQLVTALMGGALALVLFYSLRKKINLGFEPKQKKLTNINTDSIDANIDNTDTIKNENI